MDEKYNGWTNRSTWNVSLWLTNDEPLYRWFMDILSLSKDDKATARLLQDSVREMWGDKTPDGDPLGPVNWLEVVTNNREQ